MKKSIITIAFIIFGTISSLKAQHDIKINVLGLTYTNYSGAYEYVLNRESGINIVAGYFTTPKIFKDLIKTGYTATGISLEYRYYLTENDDKATGFWVSPYLKYSRKKFNSIPVDVDLDSSTVDIPITDYTSSEMSLGMALGVKFVVQNIIIGAYIGTGIAGISWETISNENLKQEQKDFLDKLDPSWQLRLGINFGYRIQYE